MRTIIKVNIQHIKYSKGGVYIYESESIAIRTEHTNTDRNTEKLCVQEGTQKLCRNMDRNRNKNKTGTGMGLNLKRNIEGGIGDSRVKRGTKSRNLGVGVKL